MQGFTGKLSTIAAPINAFTKISICCCWSLEAYQTLKEHEWGFPLAKEMIGEFSCLVSFFQLGKAIAEIMDSFSKPTHFVVSCVLLMEEP